MNHEPCIPVANPFCNSDQMHTTGQFEREANRVDASILIMALCEG